MHWTAMLILAEELSSEVEIGCDRFQYSTCDGQIESPTKSKNHANTSYDEGINLTLYPWRVPLHLTIDEGHVPCRFNFWQAWEGTLVKQRMIDLCHDQWAGNAHFLLVVIVRLNLFLHFSSTLNSLARTSTGFVFGSPGGDQRTISITMVRREWIVCCAPRASTIHTKKWSALLLGRNGRLCSGRVSLGT